MKKFIAIVALTASVMATPALAQSFDPDAGTGNVLSFSNEQTASRTTKWPAGRAASTLSPRSRGLPRLPIRTARGLTDVMKENRARFGAPSFLKLVLDVTAAN